MLDTCNFDALPSNSHPSLLWTVPFLCGPKSRGKCAEGTHKDTNAVWKRHYLAPPKPLSISSSNYLNLNINQSKNDFVLPSHLDFQRLRKSYVCGRGRERRATRVRVSAICPLPRIPDRCFVSPQPLRSSSWIAPCSSSLLLLRLLSLIDEWRSCDQGKSEIESPLDILHPYNLHVVLPTYITVQGNYHSQSDPRWSA